MHSYVLDHLGPLIFIAAIFLTSMVAVTLHIILPSTDEAVFSSWPSPMFLLTQIIVSLLSPRLRTKKEADNQCLIISASVEPPIALDKNRLAMFKKIVGHASKSEVPLLFPITESFRLVIQSMLLPSFPVNILGSVLLKSRHVLLRAIGEGEKLSWKSKVSSAGIRSTIKGDTEIDIFNTASDVEGQAVWKTVVTVIVLGKNRNKGAVQAPPVPIPRVERREIEHWSLDSSVGRQYGLLSGDLNPIHIHWTLSRIFGFKRPIAHALFLVAKAEASLRSAGIAPLYPSIIETEFKRPTLLPAKLIMTIDEEGGSLRQADWCHRAGSETGLGFVVTTALEPSTGQHKDVIVGRLWQGKSAMKKAA